MQFIHYIGGEGRNGKLVALGFGLSSDPEAHLATLKGTMPFNLKILAIEAGSAEKLELLREQFKKSHINGFWYQPTPELQQHVKAVEVVDPAMGKMTRVSLDLSPDEFGQLEKLVEETGTKGKAKFLRKALRFYAALYRYKAQGYMIQVVRGGKMVQFPDLDVPS